MTIAFRDDMIPGDWRNAEVDRNLASVRAASPAPTFMEIARQNYKDAVEVSNQDSAAVRLTKAYDEINDRIRKAVGVEDLDNPLLQGAGPPIMHPQIPVLAGMDMSTPLDRWKKRIGELKAKHPDVLPWDDILTEPDRRAGAIMHATRTRTEEMSKAAGLIEPGDVPVVGNVPLLGATSALAGNMVRNPGATIAQFAGGLAGQMTSPVDAAVNVFAGIAGSASKSILRNAVSNAAINAAAQMPLSALKMPEYAAAGLPHGWRVWLSEVEGAAAAGFVLDAGVRGAVRGARRATGQTSVMEGGQSVPLGGVLFDAVPEARMPAAPPKLDIKPETFDAAAAGDLKATREILEKTGAIDNPEIRGALDHAEAYGKLDADMLARLDEMGVARADGQRIMAGVLSGRYTRAADLMPDIARMRAPLEPQIPDAQVERVVSVSRAALEGVAPRLSDLVAHAVEARIGEIEGPVRRALTRLEEKGDPAAIARDLAAEVRKALADPEIAASISRVVHLTSGRASPVDIAQMVQADPMIRGRLNPELGRDADALALATLDRANLDRVISGEVPSSIAVHIANHVRPEFQARAFDDMARARPQTVEDAIRLIDEMVPDAPRPQTPLDRSGGIADPLGPEAKAQVEAMKQEAADAIKAAQEPIKERDKLASKVETLKGEIAKIEEKAGDDGQPMFALNTEIERQLHEAMSKANPDVDPNKITILMTSNIDGSWEVSSPVGNIAAERVGNTVRISGAGLDDYRPGSNLKGRGYGMAMYRRLIDEALAKGLTVASDTSVSKDAQAIYAALKAKGYAVEQNAGAEEGTGGRLQTLYKRFSDPNYAKPVYTITSGPKVGDKMFAISDADATTYAKKRSELHDTETKLAEAQARLNPDPEAAQALYRVAMAAVAQRRAMDVHMAVAHALAVGRQIAPEGTRFEVRGDELRDPGSGALLDAYYERGSIVLATYAADPAARVSHEVVHALVDRNALTGKEVDLLAAEAAKAGAFPDDMRAKYAKAYKDRENLDRLLAEEAAAHLIDARVKGKADAPDNTVANRVAQLIEKIRNLLNGYGFKSAEDVVAAIMNGDAGRRETSRVSRAAAMDTEDLHAVATPDGVVARDGRMLFDTERSDQTMFAFAGERARTADLEALARAKEMDASGADRGQIWTETGWFKKKDDKWRFEIDDSKVRFSDLVSIEKRKPYGVGDEEPFVSIKPTSNWMPRTLGEVLVADELFAQYPALRDVPIQIKVGESYGGGSFDGKLIALGGFATPDEALNVTIHEIQHWVQKEEGFGQGGNTDTLRQKTARALFELDYQIENLRRGSNVRRDLERLRKQLKEQEERFGGTNVFGAPEDAIKAYERLIGEVEARNATFRRLFTAEQRRDSHPLSTEDVAETDQFDVGDLVVMDRDYRPKIADPDGLLEAYSGRIYTTADNDALKQQVADLMPQLVGKEVAFDTGNKHVLTQQDVENITDDFDYHGGSWLKRGDDLNHIGQALREIDAKAVDEYLKAERYLAYAAMDPQRSPEDQQIVRFADGKSVSQHSYSAEPPVDGPAMSGMRMYAIRAYHGSPHDFDRFSMDKIGTGEGAQAYGHGLYFAENEGVAKDYRNKLAGKPYIEDADAAAKYKADTLAWLTSRQGEPPAPPDMKQPGRMYEVSIKADPNDFLDWDKPLSQQSEKARNVLTQHGVTSDAAHTGNALNSAHDWSAAINGWDRDGARKILAEDLRKAGIPGIRYLDQGSRTAGEGSRNYVVFDDSLIEIVAKDGKPVEASERKDVIDGMGARPDDDGRMYAMADNDTAPPRPILDQEYAAMDRMNEVRQLIEACAA